MAHLADDPRVAEFLLFLWNAPDREAGIAIVGLPTRFRDESLITVCEGEGLIRFARRKHCWHGSGAHRELILEIGWDVAELNKPGRKPAWQLLQEAIDEDVSDEIRLRIQLTHRGSVEASRIETLQSEDMPPAPKPKRRGRQKADYETVQREAQLAAEWKRAHENKVFKAEFAREKKMKVADLDRLLDRVRARDSRSEK